MNKCKKSRFAFSEKEMANAFQNLLKSQNGIPEIGVFNDIYREINCCQGRPDFIALRYLSDFKKNSLTHISGFVSPSILSLLKPTSSRTLNYIISHTGYTYESIKKTLRQLIYNGHIEQTEAGAYRLGKEVKEVKTELWAFELKLSNPRRAVFQAQQSRAFAEYAMIVVPPGQERNYTRFSETIKRWGIGLATFDPINNNFCFVKKGRRAKAFSQMHRFYALSQMV